MQENLASHIIDIYRRHGRAWTELRGDVLYEKNWLNRFSGLLPENAEILDLGCGSGKTIAAYLIAQGHDITGVDSAEVMIEMAQQNFPDHTWLRQDMREISLYKTFAGILAWDSFFHLRPDDQRRMFAIFACHARLGTVLMFTSGPSHGEAIGELFGDALYHASLAPQEYESLLQQYGFQVIKMIAEDEECTGHTVWLVQKQNDEE